MKTNQTKAVISTIENGEKVYIKYKTFLGAKPVCETVPFEEATFFEDPEKIKFILENFLIPEPKIEKISVTVETLGEVADKKEKYQFYSELVGNPAQKETSVSRDTVDDNGFVVIHTTAGNEYEDGLVTIVSPSNVFDYFSEENGFEKGDIVKILKLKSGDTVAIGEVHPNSVIVVKS